MGSVLVEIRTAIPSDAVGLSDVFETACRGAYAGIIPALHLERTLARRGSAWWAQLIRRAGTCLIIIEVGERIAGYALVGPCQNAQFACDGEIRELSIQPDFQGLGFGRRLLVAALRRLGKGGRRKIAVSVLADNEVALAFYARMGGKSMVREQERFGATALPKVSFMFEI
jgi:ribosomal protein S18 acetylase RimI-like enzyme